MTQNGVGSSVIVNHLQSVGVQHEIGVPHIITLHQNGVDQQVITLMQQLGSGKVVSQPVIQQPIIQQPIVQQPVVVAHPIVKPVIKPVIRPTIVAPVIRTTPSIVVKPKIRPAGSPRYYDGRHYKAQRRPPYQRYR